MTLSVVELAEETRLAHMFREGEWVVVRAARSAARRQPPRHARGRGRAEDGGASFVDINDNATARAGMSALMLSAAIERSTGLETIPHLTTRDATVLGLESSCSARTRRGSATSSRHRRPARGRRLPGVARCLRGGRDRAHPADLPPQPRRGLQRPRDRRARPRSSSASRVNPTADDLDARGRALPPQARGRRDFAMTQIIFDLELPRPVLRAARRRRRRSPCSSASSRVWSHPLALRLHNEVPGILVPDHVQEALRDAGPDGPKVGMELARELIEASRSRAARRLPRRAVPAAARRCSSCSRTRLRKRRSRRDPARAPAERLANEVGRDARSRRSCRYAKRRRCRPLGRAVEQRPARVSVPHPAAEARDPPRHRPAAVRVLAQHRRRTADAPGMAVNGPFSG